MARLLLTTPEGQQVVTLGRNNSLGRHPDSTVQILDKIVSKEHCRIQREKGGWILQDLGSLNGTFLNSERVSGSIPLHHGDELALGATKARFEVRSGDTQPPPVFSPVSVAPMTPMTPGGTHIGLEFSVDKHQLEQKGPGTLQGAPRVPIRLAQNSPQIGTQLNVLLESGFSPYAELEDKPDKLSADYERLRCSHELSREICLERDRTALLDKILTSMFRFVPADRGVILLVDENGNLQPEASLRRDGGSATISVSSTILKHVMSERASVLTHDAAMDFAGSKGRSMILNRISSAIVAPLLHEEELLGVLWLDSQTLARFEEQDLALITSIAGQAAMFIEINRLGEKVEQEIVNRERFSRLLSPNVAKKVLNGEMVIQKGGQLVQQCTVFNSDIRGFTRMSEAAEPEQLLETLNEYFELMVEHIFDREGTLDKFMGDGIMALWGAPVLGANDAAQAISCAVEQMETLRQFNIQRRSLGTAPLEIGIGIHTGPVVAGYIGSSKALSYTVIGDTANTSARLCAIADPGQILVSEQTIEAVGEKFPYLELPAVALKGKEKTTRIFAIRPPRFAVSIPVAPPSSSAPPHPHSNGSRPPRSRPAR